MLFNFILLIAAAVFASGCSSQRNDEEGNGAGAPAVAAATATERPYLLEQVDDAAVVQLYADGFSSLPLREKTLVYHLYQAALAGRDIYIDQRHRNSLEMRGVFEQIIAHPQGVEFGLQLDELLLHDREPPGAGVVPVGRDGDGGERVRRKSRYHEPARGQ